MTDVRHPNTILPSNDPATVELSAQALLIHYGLTDWTFGWDRAVRRQGSCQHHRRRITLSTHFVSRNTPDEIKDTLLHEVAHALVGPRNGHGPVWRDMARRVGCRAERCGNGEMPMGKWRAECPGCGRRFSRHKRPRGVKWWCRACGRERGLLTWKGASEGG